MLQLMKENRKRRTFILSALAVGGACGAGVGLGLYPRWAGVAMAALVAVSLAVALIRMKTTGDR